VRLRILDYQASPGGGLRFGAELLRALHALRPEWSYSLVTHGVGLERWSAALADADWLRIEDVPARGPREVRRILGIRGTARLQWAARRWIGWPPRWAFEPPAAALRDCDALLLPWVHRHRIATPPVPVVGALIDAIWLEQPDVIAPAHREAERALMRDWIDSPAVLCAISETTRRAFAALFGVPASRFELVPLAATHQGVGAPALPAGFPFAARPFLLCPANTSPHKGHETLLRGLARAGTGLPLVLCGHGTEAIASGAGPRGAALADCARAAGLAPGRDLLALGFVPDAEVAALTRAATAVCLPTLAEGHGFPLAEALLAGVPVLASDVPALRELAESLDAPVLWFPPGDADGLAAALRALASDTAGWRSRARAAAPRAARRSWREVAEGWAALLERAAAQGNATSRPSSRSRSRS
jgi:glycosyltransferase involved in cell wall biosynthesis